MPEVANAKPVTVEPIEAFLRKEEPDGLLLPILFHCVDDQGRPMLGPPRLGPDTDQFRRTAYKDILAVVEEMRQYWMPTRFKTRS